MIAIVLAAGQMAAGTAAGPNAALFTGSPATTNNDDSCDIGVYPAATLLLPYFEVDVRSPQEKALTTLFTVVNVGRLPQIAHVTVWTDAAYPVLDFNLFLTGYDVQAINMYDVLVRGVIAPPGGTSSTTTPGTLSAANNANPNFDTSAAASCATLPGVIPASLLKEVQNVLTIGRSAACTSPVGNTHYDAIGYVTIDVVSTCATSLPTDSRYYSEQILFDNALIGDYQQINPNPQTGNYAGGNPMVHIRAVPEGGPAGSIPVTNLPYTFYDRYTNQVAAGVPRTVDRRQPLPSSFAARFIQGGRSAFNTSYKIWREGVTGSRASCAESKPNSALLMTELLRFDEHEFPQATGYGYTLEYPVYNPALPATSATSTSMSTFPPMISPSGDVAGWMFMNLDNLGQSCQPPYNWPCAAVDLYSAARPGFGVAGRPSQRQSQNWVVVSMFAEGRYAVDFDATALGNGCTPAPGLSDATPIGPAGGALVCPPNGGTCVGNAVYTGSNATP